ncbi:MAG: hypothetical protein JF595_14810 [Sphingomonadales bacterium]|nr:hypothetical protein [Sphingomonadales bacterium]
MPSLMDVQRLGGLPHEPLAAAAKFYAEILPGIQATLTATSNDLVIVFEPADYRHRGWRLAAIQQLARDHAPVRVNAVAGAEPAVSAAIRYLEAAPGVTGQLLVLDGNGAGEVLSRVS